jgi:outer membrane immunogenic protein
MKGWFLAAAVAFGVSNSAFADDAAVGEVVVVDESFSWSGVYGGVHGGYQWQHHRTGFTGTDTGVEGIWSQYQAGQAVGPSDAPDGFLAGGQLGYNHQIDSMVLGLEADLSYVDAEASTDMLYEFPSGTTLESKSSREIEFFGTVRARVGYLPQDRLLVFATGGLAFGNSKSSYSADGPLFNPVLSVSGSDETEVGFTVGAGAEYALDSRWSIKAEYLYYDLGDSSWTIVDNYNFVSTLTGKTENDGSIVRVGINYRFGAN